MPKTEATNARGGVGNKSSAVAEMGDRLATIEIDRKERGCCARLGGAGPHLTQLAWAEAYLRTKRHLDPSSRLATTDMGRKLGAVTHFVGSWIPM